MNNKFTQWSQLIMCDKIKPNEKVVLMVILNCNNMGWSYIAHSEIMRQSGLSESTTKRALAKLKKMGLITEAKSNINNMNNYIVSGFNLNGLITSGVNLTPQVGSKTTISGFNLTCNNNINKKDIDNNMDYNNSTGRDTTKQTNNNMDFKKRMYMELNSHPAVQSKDWTKETKEEKTHSSSAGTTKVIQIGDTRYAVETANTDYSSIWDSFPGGTASRENKKLQRVTTTEDRKDNTLSNASLHNENEDNPNEAKSTTAGQNTNPKTAEYNHEAAGATETAHRGFNGAQVDNYPTHAEKTPQERNNEGNMDTHNPMDCGGMSIDALEDIYNGGNPTQPISKVRSQTTSKAKSNEGGGGHKFTPRKQWDIEYRLALQHIDNSSDVKSKLTIDDIEILFEGANDKYRAIDTLKAVDRMLLYRVKFPRYLEMLQTAIETIRTNEEVYSPKQYDYAWNIYDKCFDRYEKITN